MVKILILIAAVSMDGFAAAIGIGSAGIKLPFRSAVIVSFTGTLFLGISAALAGTVGLAVPEIWCRVLSFVLLTALGIIDLMRKIFRDIISRKGDGGENPAMLLFDGTAADKDDSKSISAGEAAALSVALSADSAVTGIGAGLGDINIPLLLAMTFAAGLGSVLLGHRLGKTVLSHFECDLGWVCGAMLILLAFINISGL